MVIYMNVFKYIKQTVYSACLYFTVTEFLIIILATAGNILSGNGFFSLTAAALTFLACFVIAALNIVWKLDRSTPLKLVIHYLGSIVAVMPLLFGIGIGNDIGRLLVCVLAFTVIYAVIAFVILLVSSICKNRRTEDFEYESQFGDIYKK